MQVQHAASITISGKGQARVRLWHIHHSKMASQPPTSTPINQQNPCPLGFIMVSLWEYKVHLKLLPIYSREGTQSPDALKLLITHTLTSPCLILKLY